MQCANRFPVVTTFRLPTAPALALATPVTSVNTSAPQAITLLVSDGAKDLYAYSWVAAVSRTL